MADEARIRRIAERARVSISQTLEREVKDHRIGFLTITDVRVTGDLQHVTVYYTVLGDERDRKRTRRALSSARGLLRSRLGRALGLRLTPTLRFEEDHLGESAASLEETLYRARLRDQEIAAQAAGAEYAGEADPYKRDEADSAADESEDADIAYPDQADTAPDDSEAQD